MSRQGVSTCRANEKKLLFLKNWGITLSMKASTSLIQMPFSSWFQPTIDSFRPWHDDSKIISSFLINFGRLAFFDSLVGLSLWLGTMEDEISMSSWRFFVLSMKLFSICVSFFVFLILNVFIFLCFLMTLFRSMDKKIFQVWIPFCYNWSAVVMLFFLDEIEPYRSHGKRVSCLEISD